MTQTKTIVVLKTEGVGCDAYAEAICAKGFNALVESVLGIDYLNTDFPSLRPDTALVFTSAHGVESFVRYNSGRDHPVFAVGDNSAQAALSAGFTNVISAQGDVRDLADVMIKLSEKTPLISPIYVRAEDISYDFKEILREKGINMREIIGYRAVEVEKLSIKLLHALDNNEIKAVMFFSARGAECFSSLIQQYGRVTRLKSAKALCIASSVVKSVSVLPFETIQIANRTDRHGMMELIDNFSIL
jgi:uroporphyrinogen-III synthase